MKKFLSLVLALVMTMSLVTISAGAKDFTDNSKITYKEAVDVVSEIGIVDGYEDGAFNPTNTLTRGAAAKIICNLILGPTTASALSADTAPFKDVPTSNTFAGYIAYCSQQGIISGYADGTFRPAATLTGYAFMKMLLGALGYDSSIEGFVGANWSVQVGKLALGIGLNDGYNGDFVGTAAVNREEACLFTFNTLQATMVEYDSKITANVNGAEVTIGNSKAKDVSWSGSSNADGNIKGDEKVQFAERYFSDLKKTSTDSDDFGRPSNEWKFKNTNIGNYVDSSLLKETYTKKVSKGNLYDLVGKGVVDALGKKEGTLTVYENGIPVTVPTGADAYATYLGNYFNKNDSGKIGSPSMTGNGVVTEVYMDTDSDNNDIITVVQYNTWLYQATEDYNTRNESVKIKTTDSTFVSLKSYELKADDFDNLEDIKKDDYLLITAVKTSAASSIYEAKTVEVAELLEGVVSEYASGDNVTLDGTKYDYSQMAGGDTTSTMYTVGESARVVMDKYGYVIGVDTALVSSNYVFIAGIDRQFTNLKNSPARGDAYFTDGTEAEIIINKLYDGTSSKYLTSAAAIDQAAFENTWYTFSKTNDGYTLHPVEKKYIPSASNSIAATTDVTYMNKDASNPKKALDVLINGKAAFMNGSIGTIGSSDASITGTRAPANESSILILRDSDDTITAYTGVDNFPDVSFKFDSVGAKNEVYVKYILNGKTGYADYIFVDAYNATDASISDNENVALVYVLKWNATGKTTSNKNYTDYKVWDLETGEEAVIRADADLSNVTKEGGTIGNPGDAASSSNKDVYGAYYKTSTNSDDFLTNIQPVTDSGKYFTDSVSGKASYANGVLKIGVATYRLTANSKVVLVTREGSGVNVDPSAAYVAAVTDGSGVEATLSAVTVVNGTATGKYIDDAGKTDVVDTIYITVRTATKAAVNPVTATKGGNVQFSDAKAGTYANTATVEAGDKVYVKANSGYAIDVANTSTTLTSEGDGVYSFICNSTGTYNIATVVQRDLLVTVKSGVALYVSKLHSDSNAIQPAEAISAVMDWITNEQHLTLDPTTPVTFSSPTYTFHYGMQVGGTFVKTGTYTWANTDAKDYASVKVDGVEKTAILTVDTLADLGAVGTTSIADGDAAQANPRANATYSPVAADEGKNYISGYETWGVTNAITNGASNAIGATLTAAKKAGELTYVKTGDKVKVTVSFASAGVSGTGVTFSTAAGTFTDGDVTSASAGDTVDLELTLGTVSSAVTVTLTVANIAT